MTSDARGFRDGDYFDRAELDDLALDRAADHELREMDMDDLLGDGVIIHPTVADAIAYEARIRRAANRETT